MFSFQGFKMSRPDSRSCTVPSCILHGLVSPSQLTMGTFPEDFSLLLIVIAVIEGFAGIAKSKSKEKRWFWAVLFVEIVCAAVQSTALIMTAERGRYSRLETAAAYVTVIVDALLLIGEAILVRSALKHIESSARLANVTASIVAAVSLGLFGMPLFLAKLAKRKEKKLFKAESAAKLMLALPIIPGVLGLIYFFNAFLAHKQRHSNEDDHPICRGLIQAVVLICSTGGVSLALGIRIVKGDENLSLAFLVISNIYPALVTFISGGAYIAYEAPTPFATFDPNEKPHNIYT